MKHPVTVAALSCLTLMELGGLSALSGERWDNPQFQPLSIQHLGPYVKLSDGRLMTVHGNATRHSTDDAQSWSTPRPIYTGEKPGIPPPPGIAMSAMVKTADGAIVLVYRDQSTYHWEWDAAQGKAIDPRMDVWSIRSLDKTWLDRQRIFQGYCGAIIDMIQTKSGQLVIPVQRYLTDPARHATCTYASADNGKTWRRSNLIDLGGAGAHAGAIEGTLVELQDGRLYMLLRTPWDRFWEAFSWDGGLSWRQIQPSGIIASRSPGYLTRLASGRLVLIWNSILPAGQPRPLNELLNIPPPQKTSLYTAVPANPFLTRRQVSIALSQDEGKTWIHPTVIAREGKRKGLAYLSLFERSAGLLWIFSEGSHSSICVSVHETDLLEN